MGVNEYVETNSVMTLKHPHPRAQNTHFPLSDPAAHLEEVHKNEGPRDKHGGRGA